MSRNVIREWPGLMRLETAASYCDMTPSEFSKAVAVGELPPSMTINGIERWRQIEIEEHSAQRTAWKPPNWRQKAKLYGNG